MDTKLKKSSRTLYIAFFVICVCAFLTCIISIVAAASLNGFSWYADPGAIIQEEGYGSFEEYLRNNVEAFPAIWNVFEKHMKVWLAIAIASGIVALLSLIYLVLSVGERDEAGKIVISRFDCLFSEVQLVGVCIIFFLGGAFFVQLVQVVLDAVYELGRYYSTFDIVLNAVVAIITGLISASLGLGLGLSCVKKVKAGEFLNYSIFGLIFFSLYKGVYRSGSPMRRVVLMLILICILSATMFLAPVVLIMILVFAPKWVQRYDEIRNGLDEVNSGNLDYKIPVHGEDELDQLAIGINKITEATSIAVQNELKNQRMKTDLISNVSHDLKTPLTSMVTYIHLLRTEGLDSPQAPEYLAVLQQKTERLQQLTEDLFEAAKASSGAMPVRMSRVDLLSLLNQGLGEMNESVEESHLEFIIAAKKEHYFVKADGQLLWRVISNLLSNIFKYSQEGTRVYINFQEGESTTDDLVFMEIKNISRQSLNINPAELMERFKRGDESRSTEGSGLGLAIAKDLMKLMGGRIDIAIDGDLFKAKLMLHAASEDDSVAADVKNESQGQTFGMDHVGPFSNAGSAEDFSASTQTDVTCGFKCTGSQVVNQPGFEVETDMAATAGSDEQAAKSKDGYENNGNEKSGDIQDQVQKTVSTGNLERLKRAADTGK